MSPKVLCAQMVLALFVFFADCRASCSPTSIVVAISPRSAFVGSGQTLHFAATVTAHPSSSFHRREKGRCGYRGGSPEDDRRGDASDVTWSISGSSSGSIDAQGNYTAPIVTQNSIATVTATSVKDPSKSASAFVIIIASGIVSATANVQVAQYTIEVPDGLTVLVQFGVEREYGMTTWALPAPSGGGPVSILVAGMKGNTKYHMRAVFQVSSSTAPVFSDADHVFTTGAYPVANLPSLTVMTTPGQMPQSGVELLDLINPGTTHQLTKVVTDLDGNVLWAYDPGTSVPADDITDPIKLLPNGHFLINLRQISENGLNAVLQEVDLTGQVVWQMTAARLNAALAAATCTGCNITVIGTHHDFAVLPNGHLILLAATQQTISGTVVLGDALIDLDQNHTPVWLWNSFDRLDVNRDPVQLSDWTHSNAVVYSPDDKSLVLSMRSQSWVIKINYNDGAGDGRILWTLGYQGDFTLLPGTTNATSPVDWFSLQHDANIISSTTAGTLDVLLFDNGNQRILDSSGTLCSPSTTPCNSRVPILRLDENAKTADILWVDELAPIFSSFGGSARQLKNGNIEFDECVAKPAPVSAAIYEVTRTTPPTIVWQELISGQYAYRGFRLPSLYPGVQW